MQKEGSLTVKFMDHLWGLSPLPPIHLSLQLAFVKPRTAWPHPWTELRRLGGSCLY